MYFNCMSFDLDWNDAIVSGWYFESWLDNPNSCLLFTVSSASKKSTVLFLIPGIWQEFFFWLSIPGSISMSGTLWHMMKLWANLKSAILSLSAIIPNTVIGDPSAVFNFVMVALYRHFQTAVYSLVCGISDGRYGCSWIFKCLVAICLHVTVIVGHIHNECHCHLLTWR